MTDTEIAIGLVLAMIPFLAVATLESFGGRILRAVGRIAYGVFATFHPWICRHSELSSSRGSGAMRRDAGE